uniref:Uncharacterized protein n=1 Tax=Ananas comosus var. bracteatus TaxID=296719 RepID=A0A6V7QMK4_ANACO|nr:unnamed protein product [Ananas comosus var. bracteatus]
MKRVESVEYCISLSPRFASVYDVLHVSAPGDYVFDLSHVTGYAPLALAEDLSYVEQLIRILIRQGKKIAKPDCSLSDGIMEQSMMWKLYPSYSRSLVESGLIRPNGQAFPLGGRTHWEPWSWFSPHVVLGCYRFIRERLGSARKGRSSVDSALPRDQS